MGQPPWGGEGSEMEGDRSSYGLWLGLGFTMRASRDWALGRVCDGFFCILFEDGCTLRLLLAVKGVWTGATVPWLRATKARPTADRCCEQFFVFFILIYQHHIYIYNNSKYHDDCFFGPCLVPARNAHVQSDDLRRPTLKKIEIAPCCLREV